MSKLVTIYTAHPENVSQIIQMLESHGLNPVVVDDVGKMGAYRNLQIRIAVPPAERDKAVEVLTQAEQSNKKRLFELVKTTNAIFLIIIALLVLVAIVGFFDKQGKWFFVTWILITTIAGVALIRLAWHSKSHD
jgi:hypothetical protein